MLNTAFLHRTVVCFLCVVLLTAWTSCSEEDDNIPVTEVVLNQNELKLSVGESVLLTADVLPAEATDRQLSWSSSNPDVAEVDDSGRVTALKPGLTSVVALATSGVYALCSVICSDASHPTTAVESLAFGMINYFMDEGETQQLTVDVLPYDATEKDFLWMSTDTSVATVDNQGRVKALKEGQTKLVVTTMDGTQSASCTLYVLGAGRTQSDHTILIYFAADNSLRSYCKDDLAEVKEGMKQVSASSRNHLIVYCDLGQEPYLMELKKNGQGEVEEHIIKTWEPRNSVGQEEMQEVLNELTTNRDLAAKSYSFVYWSHGDGWIPNPLPQTRWIGQDTGNGAKYMNIDDLTSILKKYPKMDFILFDACFMLGVEVAYAMRHCAEYVIACPTETPGPGVDYARMIPAMMEAGDDIALKTAAAFYDPYGEIYNGGKGLTNENWTAGIAVGAIYTAELEKLATLTRQMLAGVTEVPSGLANSSYDYDKRKESSHIGYYDMVQLMQRLLDTTQFSVWKQAYNATLPYWKTTPMVYSNFVNMFSMEEMNGISHYVPLSSKPQAAAAYRQTEWYVAAGLEQLGW